MCNKNCQSLNSVRVMVAKAHHQNQTAFLYCIVSSSSIRDQDWLSWGLNESTNLGQKWRRPKLRCVYFFSFSLL